MANRLDNKFIISQNCLNGYIYKLLHRQFNHPLFWCVIDFNSLVYLIENFDIIKFEEYELKHDDEWNFYMLVDGHVKVQFVHYKLNKKYHVPTKTVTDHDIEYDRIWEYIVEKYESRLKRMKENMCEPLFLISNGITVFRDCVYTSEQLQFLKKYKNVIVFDGLDRNLIYKNAEIILKKLNNSID